MLPAAGFRYYNTGALTLFGKTGYYWASTNVNNNNTEYGWHFEFIDTTPTLTFAWYRGTGMSVRCVQAE
jgi:uncharacterized protein (TIGR02145 family)